MVRVEILLLNMFKMSMKSLAVMNLKKGIVGITTLVAALLKMQEEMMKTSREILKYLTRLKQRIGVVLLKIFHHHLEREKVVS